MPKFTPNYVRKRLDCTYEQAEKVSALLLGDIDPLVYGSAERYERQCLHSPPRELLVLYACDEILETFGVEGWYDERSERGFSYCNTGDTYTNTVCLVNKSQFRLTSYANLR